MLLTGSFPHDPALDMALSAALVRAVADGRHPPAVRLYRPGPTVAFSRRDSLEPGFARACAAARARAFEPVVRSAGGRAAAYDGNSLILERALPTAAIAEGIHDRFDATGDRLVEALRDLGLDARMGQLSGEYCPGEHSINLGGARKIGGLAQRVVRGAALVSAVVVVGSGPAIRAVIADVYAALGLEHDPAVTGAIEDAAPGLTVDAVADRLALAFAPGSRSVEVDDGLLAAARAVRSRHAVP